MSAADATTPRVFLCRHGETEWSRNGRYTGRTDLALLPSGEAQVLGTAHILVGSGKLIDLNKVVKFWVSPRQRAGRTAALLFGGKDGGGEKGRCEFEETEELAEWDYGEYEGLMTDEIRRKRKTEGKDEERGWDIWRDGCVGGESPEQVTARLDTLISKIHALQAPHMRTPTAANIVLVAHGHILRAFTKRWLKYPLEFPLSMMLEPGGIGIMSYQHQSISEPAFFLGMGFPLSTNSSPSPSTSPSSSSNPSIKPQQKSKPHLPSSIPKKRGRPYTPYPQIMFKKAITSYSQNPRTIARREQLAKAPPNLIEKHRAQTAERKAKLDLKKKLAERGDWQEATSPERKKIHAEAWEGVLMERKRLAERFDEGDG